ncbi:hypothetical protein F3Y22_tig00110831pilonHSYRG00634 [Hibiscus syriacus]|uniref:Uncharacterized protein n=1 Tax=Hibiscus syriacus TaxID=106335 RepID=A0A6A2ZMF1_HIBSY|nr:hypothetical protein F3Y22_tig00110831pilonHSYRG00634 [Hibiscus syriacus]
MYPRSHRSLPSPAPIQSVGAMHKRVTRPGPLGSTQQQPARFQLVHGGYKAVSGEPEETTPENFHVYRDISNQNNYNISSVKVELQHLILSILDDPVISRVSLPIPKKETVSE